jgi:uncharacterized protein YprB with RNaseH-like and TPR domain
MSTLKDRLRGIVSGAVPRVASELLPPGGAGEEGASAGQRLLDAQPVPSRGLSDAGLARAAEVLGGTVTATAAGAAIVVDRQYAATDRHGSVTIGEIADVLLEGEESLAILTAAVRSHGAASSDARLPTSDSRRQPSDARLPTPDSRHDPVWFLDLETTGLAGGAGTQAFLVGCARLDGDGLSVRQFLLPGYEHERALLAEVSAWAAAQGAIVTFNGKSFDVPLIETRYLFHRQPFPLEGRAHVDMLHPARRLWRARGELEGSSDASCSLAMLERLLAGVHRVGDVPGYEIPSRYFQFVRDGDARRLHSVLEHNRLDLVSLALVMARAIALVERGPVAATTPYECYGLARIYDRAGRHDDAEAAYVRAIDFLARVGRDPDTWADALRRLAYCRRRTGRWREAAAAWQALANLPRCPAALLHEAREGLAIYHEHRARDLDTARAHARWLVGETASARRHDAAEHRLRRIERKLASDVAAGRQWSLDLDGL